MGRIRNIGEETRGVRRIRAPSWSPRCSMSEVSFVEREFGIHHVAGDFDCCHERDRFRSTIGENQAISVDVECVDEGLRCFALVGISSDHFRSIECYASNDVAHGWSERVHARREIDDLRRIDLQSFRKAP